MMSSFDSTGASNGPLRTARQRQRTLFEARQHPGQHRSAVVGGGGELDLTDHFLQLPGIDFGDHGVAVDGRKIRKVVRVEAIDAGFVPAALHLQGVLASFDAQIDVLAGGQGIDEFGQEPGVDGQRARFGHPGVDPGRDADFEIGRRNLEARVVRSDQDIAQNRHRRLGRDRPGDLSERALQVLLKAGSVHLAGSSSARPSSPRPFRPMCPYTRVTKYSIRIALHFRPFAPAGRTRTDPRSID
jgi:hypothetical protein